MTVDSVPWPTGGFTPWPDTERDARLAETRSRRPDGPLWVFAFGSLMWNPEFEFDVSAAGYLSGWERKFHIWTTVTRGTAERPGLGLCLEQGQGGCRGIVYRLLPENEDRDWKALWNREMSSGIYLPLWVAIDTETHGRVDALTFVVDREHRQYAGRLPAETKAWIIAGASGRYGRCRDYLAGTVEGMAKLGDRDPYLEDLLMRVDALTDKG